MTKIKSLCFTLGFSLFCAASAIAQTNAPAPPQMVSIKKIWSAGKHNAFTDLIRYKDQWFCTFRESEAHVGGNGQVRVLVSDDGEKWESAALLTEEGVDLRDPKFSITPDNRLMMVLGGSIYEGKTLKGKQPRTTFSTDGRTWTTPQRVLAEGDWLWRVTWHKDHAYGIVYISVPAKKNGEKSPEWGARLVESTNGVDFHTVKELEITDRPNEATLRFLENGDGVILIRREGGDKAAWIGVSHAPYKDWQWKPAGMFVGGPNFIVLPNGSMVAGGREMHPSPVGAKMFIGKMDKQSVTPQLTLPSGGDCSYPGLVWHDGLLWVSYYSSHAGQTCIYLAKVKL